MENLKFRLHDKDGVVIGYEEHKKNEHGCYQIWQKSLRGYFYTASATMNVREGFFIAAHHKCQLTGLTDKNGKSVYEGDFVLISDNEGSTFIYEIKHREDLYMFVGVGNGEWLCLEEFEGCEIIGNVHENPELIGN